MVSCVSGNADPDHYLPLSNDMQSAIQALLASELFKYHTDRMLGIVMSEAQEVSVYQGLT